MTGNVRVGHNSITHSGNERRRDLGRGRDDRDAIGHLTQISLSESLAEMETYGVKRGQRIRAGVVLSWKSE